MDKSGTPYVPVSDQVGTVWNLLNSSAAKANSYTYDAFGVGRSTSETISNLYRFGTKRLEADPALYHFVARLYDPPNGRFVSVDRLAYVVLLCPYCYVQDMPTRYVDPTGEAVECDGGNWQFRGTGRGGTLIFVSSVRVQGTFECHRRRKIGEIKWCCEGITFTQSVYHVPMAGGGFRTYVLAAGLKLELGVAALAEVHGAPSSDDLARWKLAGPGIGALWLIVVRRLGPSREGDGLTPLHRAAKAGDVERVEAMLDGGAPVDTPGRSGITPLGSAALAGQLAAAQVLVAHGANVNAGNGLRPLDWAIGSCRLDIVRFLVEAGAEVNYRGADGWSPLAHAVYNEVPDIVEYLLQHGADPNRRDDRGWTPLYLARGDAVKLLIAAGAQVDARDCEGRTPLHQQAYSGDADGLEYLLGHRAEVNARDVRGRTPLDAAEEREPGPDRERVIHLLRTHGGLRATAIHP